MRMLSFQVYKIQKQIGGRRGPERCDRMLPVILNVLRPYAAYITFPVALVFGFIGYNIEGWVSDKYTPYNKSIQEIRRERQEKEGTSELVIPKTIFEKNLSPSLMKEDSRGKSSTNLS